MDLKVQGASPIVLSLMKDFDQVQQEIIEHYPVLGGARPSLVFVVTWDKVAAYGPPLYILATHFRFT